MSAIQITKENFRKEVIESEVPVLLDFWADWCGPCRKLAPVIEEIAAERTDIKVGKVEIEEQMELAREFRIVSIPTLVLMKDGQIEKQLVGVRPKEQILSIL